MARDRESTGDDQQWEEEVPERVPYFDPAGAYKAILKVQFVQFGRYEEQGNSGKREFVPIDPPIECYNSDIVYESLPVDGINIVGIALLKAQQDIQAAGMIVRTPIETDEKYTAMMGMLNRPTLDPDSMKGFAAMLKSFSPPTD